MATTLTGNAANGSQHPISVAAPSSGEAAASGPIQTLLQKILDGITYLRTAPAFSGKPTATATVAGDGGTTLATKGYAEALGAASAWTTVASGFGGSWAGSLKYSKDAFGRVRLYIAMGSGGSPGTTIFAAGGLPVAYRPTVGSVVVPFTAGSAAPCFVNTDGSITTGAITGGQTYNGYVEFQP